MFMAICGMFQNILVSKKMKIYLLYKVVRMIGITKELLNAFESEFEANKAKDELCKEYRPNSNSTYIVESIILKTKEN